MGLLKSIKAIFEGWERIDKKDIPDWVDKAYWKWWEKLPIKPYYMTKHFVGKTFVYRVRHGQAEQGSAPILGWYRKKRKIKEN